MLNLKEELFDKNYRKISIYVIITFITIIATYFIFKNLNIIYIWSKTSIGTIFQAFSPLWIGLIIAYFFDPLISAIDKKLFQKILIRNNLDSDKKLKRKNQSRTLSILLAYIIVVLCFIAILYGFVALITGRFVIESIPKLYEKFTHLIISYESEIQSFAKNIPHTSFSANAKDMANSVISWIVDNFKPQHLLINIVSLGGSVFNFIIGLIVSIYILLDKEFYKKAWNKYAKVFLRSERLTQVEKTANEVNLVLSSFLRGVMIDSIIIAIISSIGLTLIGIKFAVFLGIFAGVANIIPYLGPIMGMVPAFIIGTFNDGISQGLIAIIVLLIIQQIDGNLIYPKVVGSSTGLSPLIVLLAVSIFGYFYGIIGMILAVPISGIIQLFFLKWLQKKYDVFMTKNNGKSVSP